MREALFARIQRLSFSYYDQAQTGQLMTRVTNDVEQVRTFVGAGVVQLVASAVMLVGCIGLLLFLNPLLALAVLATIVPILFVLRRFVGKMGPLFGSVQILLGQAQHRPAGGPAGPAGGARVLRRGPRGRALRPGQRRAPRPEPRR